MADIFHHYHVGLSQPCRSVLMILKLTNAPHEVHHVDFRKGDHKKPDFPNPFGKVPAIVHGDFVLTESPAIAKYILNVQKGDDHWYPADLKKRARVDEFLSYYHTSIRKAGIQIAVTCVFTPMRTGKPAPEEDKQQALNEFDEVLERFEGYFLKNGPFIAGEEISIADIFAVSEILQADFSGADYLAGHPKIKEFIERTKAALQPHFDEVFKPLNDFVKAKVK